LNLNPRPKGPSTDLTDVQMRYPRDKMLSFVSDGDAKARLDVELNALYAQWSRFDQYYHRNLRRNKNTKNTQIIAAALVPVCAILPSLQGSLLPWFSSELGNVLAAIFGGVATIFGIFNALYNSHDIVVRSIITRDRLEDQLLAYTGMTGNYGKGSDLEKVSALAAGILKIQDDENAGFVTSESKAAK
jgi:hypothetical protein